MTRKRFEKKFQGVIVTQLREKHPDMNWSKRLNINPKKAQEMGGYDKWWKDLKELWS